MKTMLNRTCSARSAGRCLVRWHSGITGGCNDRFPALEDLASFRRHRPSLVSLFDAAPRVASIAKSSRNDSRQFARSLSFTPSTIFPQQQSVSIHTNTNTHTNTQPGSQTKSQRRKHRKRRRKGGKRSSETEETYATRNDIHLQNKNGTGEKVAAFRRKETYSASILSTLWTAPSVLPSQHPSLRAVLQELALRQMNGTGLSNQNNALVTGLVHAKRESANLVGAIGSDPVLDELGNDDAPAQEWDHESDGDDEEEDADSQYDDTEKVGAHEEAVSSTTEKDDASLELDVNYAVVSSVIEKDDAFSEVGANDEIVSSSTDSEAAYKNLDVVEIKHLVVGAGDEVVSITTEKDDASLELDAGDEVVSSITEKDYSSSEAGANDEVVPRSTNSDAACKNLNVVEINEVVVGEDFDDNNPKSESESSSSSGDDKSDSSHDKDDVDDVPDLNPPSTTSSDPTKLRKAAWYLPSTASSATSKNKSTAS